MLSKDTGKLFISRRGSVRIVTLNRPSCLNAIDLDLAIELKNALGEAAADPGVRAVLITGSGQAFCSGGDLKLALSVSPSRPGDAFLALTEHLHECVRLLRNMPKPAVAAINGPAAGAGLFLALACDLRLMSESAYLKQSNTSYGLTPPAGGSWLLPRIIGTARALEMLLLDEPIKAHLALRWGLVTEVVASDTILQKASMLATRLSRMPIETLGRAKTLINTAFDNSLDDHLDLERAAVAASANAPEGMEGLRAFVGKHAPDYRFTKDAA